MKYLNERAVGKRYQAEVYEVTREAIVLYADAISAQLGSGELVAPPLFAVRPMVGVLFGAIEDPEVGIPLERLVHGEQQMRFFGVLRPGQRLVPRGELLSVEARSTGEVAVLKQWLEEEVSGEVLVEAVSVLFVRGEATGGGRSGAAATAAAVVQSAPTAERRFVIAPDQSARYARASGDAQPAASG